MIRMKVKTVINAVWVFSAWFMYVFFSSFLEKTGWIWVAIYIICLMVFRPITPFFKSLKSTDSNLTTVMRIKNKKYAIIIIFSKFITMLGMIGASAAGVILKIPFLPLKFGGEERVLSIHKVLVILAVLMTGLQLGINISVLLSQEPLSKKGKIIILSALIAASAATAFYEAKSCIELIIILVMIITGYFLVKLLAPK